MHLDIPRDSLNITRLRCTIYNDQLGNTSGNNRDGFITKSKQKKKNGMFRKVLTHGRLHAPLYALLAAEWRTEISWTDSRRGHG